MSSPEVPLVIWPRARRRRPLAASVLAAAALAVGTACGAQQVKAAVTAADDAVKTRAARAMSPPRGR